MRIVFMGTPKCAAKVLDALLENFCKVVGVFTQPDKPSGRGRQVKSCPVKKLAEENGLPVFQPENLKDPDVLDDLELLAPDIIIIVAYGKIITKEELKLPAHGAINIHYSLLPKYRGAAPVAYALKNGDTETGVSIFRIEEKLDTGPILAQAKLKIDDSDTAETLEEKLTILSIPLLFKTLSDIELGEVRLSIQDDSQATYAPQLEKSDGKIDWSKSSEEIYNHVRAMNPWPCAFTRFDKKLLKVWKAQNIQCPRLPDGQAISNVKIKSGQIIKADETGIFVKTGDGAMLLTEVQIESGKRMPAVDFVKGHKVQVGDK